MKHALISVTLAIGFVASCWVSRKTTDFECSDSEPCANGRRCDQGFCVQDPCPSDCTSCDTIAKTCLIQCDGNHHCGGVDCPSGYDCTVECSSPNACSNIACHSARSCAITCTGANACDAIDCDSADTCMVTCTTNGSCAGVMCGSKPCDVHCGTTNACGGVDCSNSCKCDVMCPSGTCGSTCPMGDVKPCTQDGTGGTACNSSTQAGCNDGC